ncbi:MAG: hypothetical protein OXI93_20745 [Bryobacterales bacterium]|nr:hypothetical protein [Bryobacterales bacterium]
MLANKSKYTDEAAVSSRFKDLVFFTPQPAAVPSCLLELQSDTYWAGSSDLPAIVRESLAVVLAR